VDLLRNDPSLIPAAINEILRMEAPIQDFSRYVGRDYDLDGVSLPEGSRAIISMAPPIAIRDSSGIPIAFDVRRDNAGRHMAFGTGPPYPWHEPRQAGDAGPVHRAARKVKRFHIEAEERVLNNVCAASAN